MKKKDERMNKGKSLIGDKWYGVWSRHSPQLDKLNQINHPVFNLSFIFTFQRFTISKVQQ